MEIILRTTLIMVAMLDYQEFNTFLQFNCSNVITKEINFLTHIYRDITETSRIIEFSDRFTNRGLVQKD